MKKKITVLIVLAIIFQCFGSVCINAEEESGNVIESSVVYTPEEQLLFSLGIANKEDYQNAAALEKSITRAEFAKFAAAILGIDVNSTYTDSRYFVDVAPTNRYAAAINELAKRGIVSGMTAENFYPDIPIQPMHAAMLLLKVAGYSDLGSLGLTYDDLVVRYDLLKGVRGTEMDFEAAANMIEAALDMPKCTLVGSKISYAVYEMDEDITMLSENFDVYKTEGIISAAGVVSIYNDFAVSENQVVIDNTIFETEIDMYDYLGLYVTAYYREEKGEVGKVILCIDEGETESLTISADDLDTITGNFTVNYYTEKGKMKTEQLPANVKVIKNGEIITRDILAELNIENGDLRLVEDQNGDWAYVFVNEYENAFVSKIDAENEKIYVKYGNMIDLASNDIKRLKVYNSNGEEINVTNITGDTLISVYASASSIEIHICDGAVNGTIESMEANKVLIGGTEYEIEKSYYEENANELKAGVSGSFYLDITGKIGYSSNATVGNYTYGFLKLARINEDSEGLMLRIFGMDGKFVVFNTPGKLTIDGARKDAESAYMDFCVDEGEFTPQLIRYALNAEGKVIGIDTAIKGKSESDLSLTAIDGGFKNRSWYSLSTLYDGKFAGKQENVIFVPSIGNISEADENDFEIAPTFSMSYGSVYSAGYSIDPDSIYADVVVVSSEKLEYDFSASLPYFWVVDSVEERYNTATDEIDVSIIAGGTFTTYENGQGGVRTIPIAKGFEVTDADRAKGCVSYDEISSGDIVEFALDGQKQIHKIRKLMDYDEKNFEPRQLGNILGNGRAFLGHAISREDNYVKVGYETPEQADEVIFVRDDNTVCHVVVYDSSRKTNRVYVGTVADILTYEETGGVASVIVPNLFNGNPHQTIIYKYGLNGE